MTEQSIPVEPGQEWSIDSFRPEDARGVTDLFQSVYGESYPIRTYLEPELLVQENREGRVISSVARIPSGAIVGHTSLFNSAPNTRIYESGAGLVHRLYRGGRGIATRLFEHGIEMGTGRPDVDLIYGEPVCNHSYSQKMLNKNLMVARAMEVNLMPAAAYAKEQSAGGRVSTFLSFLILKSRSNSVFVPNELSDQFSLCYNGLDDQCTFEIADGEPTSHNSQISIQSFEFAQVSRVAVRDIGEDFPTRIRDEDLRLVGQGDRVIQVWLNTAQPHVGWAVSTLKSMGYFFGGVLPQWFGTDGMLMQKVLDQPDWQGTVLEGERNEIVAGMVRKEWENAQA
ncbi:hypothetical protein [Desulfopila sp. IMCC35008]|uniref:hypothetical protein n=1 Tax=Desulfopila sp. IMCC35008 TaxID=2653858 RepID=UPI0013D227C9|nr:hypothetical protein [Desulfopila sp. IMCC35008]